VMLLPFHMGEVEITEEVVHSCGTDSQTESLVCLFQFGKWPEFEISRHGLTLLKQGRLHSPQSN